MTSMLPSIRQNIKFPMFAKHKNFAVAPFIQLFLFVSVVGISSSTENEVNENIVNDNFIVSQPSPLLGNNKLLQELFEKKSRDSDFTGDMNNGNFEDDDIFFQKMHLRYLMSSTAEQPDNSGRASSFSIWLTVLIAALAAAILS